MTISTGGLSPLTKAGSAGYSAHRWGNWLDRADVTIPPLGWQVRVDGKWTKLRELGPGGILQGVRSYMAMATEGPVEVREGCYGFGLALLDLVEELVTTGKRRVGDLDPGRVRAIFEERGW